jgi:endonuclease G, mitochondrial
MLRSTSYARLVVILSLLFSSFIAVAGPFDGCPEYVKYGAPSEVGNLLCRTGYAIDHNPQHKTPDWVAEHLTREKASAVLARSNNFKPDPDIEAGDRAELVDYKNSGYDRGHMAPAGDMRWKQEAMDESFFLSNMSPQIGPGMNRGIWKNLEEKVRQWAVVRGDLYVYTGPIYKTGVAYKTIGPDKVAVPDQFYKVVFDPVRVETIAFILPNMSLRIADLPSYIVSVHEVETATGLHFLSSISPDVRLVVEAKKATAIW